MHSKSVLKLAPLALALVTMVGCSGGGSSSGGAPAAAQPAVTNLNGTGSKGIVIGGLVNAYAINADGTKGDKVASETETDAKGKYTLTLNGSYVEGSPILVEITAKDGTLMRCDLATCGTDKEGNTVVFGQDYVLASNFSLSAVLPKASGTSISLNITPITQMGASLALKRIQAGASASDAAAVANAQVKNLLGIKGDITSLPVVDITDAESVNAAGADDLDYNLKAAGIVQAMRKGSSGQSVEAALTAFVEQYVTDDGLADKEDTESEKLTLQEILASAIELIEEVKKVEGVESDKEELSQSENELKTKESDKRTNGSTEVKQGEAPSDVGSEGLQATKGMVKQIRDLAAVAGLSVNQQAFANQVELAAESIKGDTPAAAVGLGRALGAIAEAWEARNNAEDGQEPNSFVADGLTVSMTESEGKVTYTIAETTLSIDETDDGTDNPVDVVVAFTAVDGTSISETESESQDPYEETFDGNLDLVVSGSASTDKVAIAVTDESKFIGTADFDYRREGGRVESGTDEGFSENNRDQGQVDLNADLVIKLTQLEPSEPGAPTVSFEGRMEIDLDQFAFDETRSEEADFQNSTYSSEDSDSLSFNDVSFLFSGNFEDSNGESLTASFGVQGGNFSETCTWSYEQQRWMVVKDDEDCVRNETEESFADAALTLLFSVDLAESADDVSVQVNATRTSLQAGKLDIDLEYGGSLLALDYSGGNSATVSNHNNVVMTLTETESEGSTQVSGNITQNGVEYATINEESGAAIVRYTDGTFESAM
ncbi:hypothetical protein [Litorivivens sp.]|uniref:hypothetical protein n=1 Tax=Litorivivens sp. TaxID=2020868 RepID=UPI003567926D